MCYICVTPFTGPPAHVLQLCHIRSWPPCSCVTVVSHRELVHLLMCYICVTVVTSSSWSTSSASWSASSFLASHRNFTLARAQRWGWRPKKAGDDKGMDREKQRAFAWSAWRRCCWWCSSGTVTLETCRRTSVDDMLPRATAPARGARISKQGVGPGWKLINIGQRIR
jgi:hypothetical protein